MGLAKAGTPDDAMSFLKEHTVVDEGHNRLMEQYLEGLIRTPEERATFLSAVRTTAELYERMLTAAANAGVAAWGRQKPVEVGV